MAAARRPGAALTRRRVPVHWGDFSIVEATLGLMRDAMAHAPRLDRLVLLSGACYPLLPPQAVVRFFDEHRDEEFLHLVRMPADADHKPMSRLETFKLRPGRALHERLLRRVLLHTGLLPRSRDVRAHIGDVVPHAGSQWWALTRPACEYVLEFVARERRFVDFFRHTHCPDESFFHTILANSPFRERVCRELTFADWSARGRSPERITPRHVERLLGDDPDRIPAACGRHPWLFARKFSDASADAVARLVECRGRDEAQES